jgi:ring-1,2-phenylacetyl-CoA epoxidase subunit PaaB
MKLVSLDPRISRANLPSPEEFQPITEGDQFETFEVFHQAKSGKHHVHVGSVHAPNHEMALVFAKEQYGRRSTTINMWIVRSTDVFTQGSEDSDIYSTVADKAYREAKVYMKVRDKIKEFQDRTNS